MCNPQSRSLQWSLASIHLILLIFSIALLSIGGRLRNDSDVVILMSGYRMSTCTLDAVQVDKCPQTGAHIAVWRRTEDQGSVLDSPFSYRSTRELATLDTNNYPFNTTFPCMCNPNVIDPYPALTCTFGDACFLNVGAVNYVQKDGFVYSYSTDTLLGIGSLLLICSVLGSLFLFISNGLCCCGKPRAETDYEKATE